MNALRLGSTADESGGNAGLYLPDAERAAHLYVVGSTGSGKSKALASWALDDLRAGRGFGIIDPHGDLISDVLAHAERLDRVRLVEFGASEMVAFNPLESLPGVDPFSQALELVDVFRKIWGLSDQVAPRLLEILRNALWTLIETRGTLLDLEPLLVDNDFRTAVTAGLDDPTLQSFWRNRYGRWGTAGQASYAESTLNKVTAFTSDPRLRRLLGRGQSTLDVRGLMDRGEVLLLDVSKGVLRTNTDLVGALFLSRIQMAAIGRLAAPPSERRPWCLYVDEFQNYATDSFAEMISEARKMGLRLVLAHQSLAQLPNRLRAIVLGNAQSFVAFRLDRRDAELLARYMGEIDPWEIKLVRGTSVSFASAAEQRERLTSMLANLPARSAVLRTKGRAPRPFSTLSLPDHPERAERRRESLRRRGLAEGWLSRRADGPAREPFRTFTDGSAAEPAVFWTSPRGSD